MKKRSGQGLNSAVVVRNILAAKKPPIPDFVPETELARSLWEKFTSARAASQWRDFDLVLLGKMVMLEMDIRQYQEKINADGPLVIDFRGNEKEHPLIAVVDRLARRQIVLVRNMQLTGGQGDPRTQVAHARKEKALQGAVSDIDDGEAELWEHPN